MGSMASKSPEQRIARAIQDFATHDGEVIPYTRALRIVRDQISTRRFNESRDEFAARLWLERRVDFLGKRAA